MKLKQENKMHEYIRYINMLKDGNKHSNITEFLGGNWISVSYTTNNLLVKINHPQISWRVNIHNPNRPGVINWNAICILDNVIDPTSRAYITNNIQFKIARIYICHVWKGRKNEI